MAAIVIICSAIAHWSIRDFRKAMLASVASSVVLIQFAAYAMDGGLDALWLVGVVFSATYAVVGAFFVGAIVLRVKRSPDRPGSPRT
jgi:hypothetical protein